MESEHPALTNQRDGSGARADPTLQVLPLTLWMVAARLADALSANLGAVGAVVGGVIGLKLARGVPGWAVTGIALGLMVALVLCVRCLYSSCIHVAALLYGRYVRATGPIGARMEEHTSEETSERFYSYRLWADRKRFTLSSEAYDKAGAVSWGTLEYAPVSRTIFTLRDATGRLILAHYCSMLGELHGREP
jgi:hypothetical protein